LAIELGTEIVTVPLVVGEVAEIAFGLVVTTNPEGAIAVMFNGIVVVIVKGSLLLPPTEI